MITIGGYLMTKEQQCEIARLMTGSTVSDEIILRNVENTHYLIKKEASSLVDKLIQKHDLPFDKAYPIVKDDFNRIAVRYDLDVAALFWIYMEWKGKIE